MANYLLQLKYDLLWEERFNELLKYRDLYGTVDVPNRYKFPEYPLWERRLGCWVNTQRMYHRKGILADWRYNKLVSVDFDFEPLDTKFEAHFSDFLKFKEKYGHVLVPRNCLEYEGLATWVSRVRCRPLKEEFKKRLNKEGFVWNSISENWQNMFRELVEFKRIHGHCTISKRRKEYIKLASWVYRMRDLKRTGNFVLLQDYKIKLLDSIGFNWEAPKKIWDKNFNNLMEFYTKYGHCNVTLNDKEFWGLGTWVYAMRKNKSKLSKEKIERLDSIGFDWKIDKSDKYYHSVARII